MGECNALRLTLPQPAWSTQGIYSFLSGTFGSLGVAASSLTPAAGLDLWVVSSAVGGLSSLFGEEDAGGAAFARGFRTSHEVNTGLARCETGLALCETGVALCDAGLMATRLALRYAATLALPLCESFAATTAGVGAGAAA